MIIPAAKNKRHRLISREVRRTFSRLQSLQDEVLTLKRQVAQMEQLMETQLGEEAAAYHIPQSLAELKPRRQPPPGKTAMEMIQGQWPGEETTEQLLTQLKGLG